ncbi:MAG: hypothetical protein GQF41_1835 [Candidatus Rifleibacterium amylolyticum]|nr:MAG: hypothetical protein GQF41_1835 [Candidatus Rifleibacterium amylolyticum]
MINKKRQELIIQNLRSISSEVRMKSIEQLLQIPNMPAQEKIKHLQVVINDPEAEVSSHAAQAVASLSAQPEAGVPPTPEPFAYHPDADDTLSQPEPVQMPPGPVLPSLHDDFQEQPVALPPISPVTPRPAEPVPSPAEPVLPPPVVAAPPVPSRPVAVATPPAPPAPPVPPPFPDNQADSEAEAFVDDPPDPSLPNLAKITNIPDMLAHIHELACNRPSGHATQLLTMARSGIEEVALTALQALFNLKDFRVAPEILNMLGEDQYSSQRRFLMLKIIMESNRAMHVPSLERILLREKDVIVKSGLVKVYARSSGAGGVATLIACLQDQDARVRANTVEVIEEQNIKGCEQKIIQLLQDPENRVKVNAAKYLVKNGYQQAFMTLRSMLVSSEVWLRDSVIFALGEIGDQASLTLLKAALKDPNQGIRLSVLKALARINNNTARQVLKAATGDPDPVVAQVANTLFEKIKNTPVREDIRYTPNAAFGSMQPQQATPPQPPQPPQPQQPQQPQQVVCPPALPAMPDLPAEPKIAPPPEAPPTPAAVTPPFASPQPKPPQPPTPVTPPTPPAPPPQPLSPEPPLSVAEPTLPDAPALPPIPPSPPAPPRRPSIPGMPDFAKPRSAELYAKLCSDSVEEQRIGSRDIAFILGDDQMILLNKAVSLADESIRINAVKILSRKKTPDAKALLEKLTSDSNETVRSMAEKALVMMK